MLSPKAASLLKRMKDKNDLINRCCGGVWNYWQYQKEIDEIMPLHGGEVVKDFTNKSVYLSPFFSILAR